MADTTIDGAAGVQSLDVESPSDTLAFAGRSLAQGVLCGAHLLAFGFDWARQIVDEFDLVPVPRAPTWVLGAVNVGGLIVPVIDIDNYFSQSISPAQLKRGQRLLVGGIQAEDAEEALAIVFSQIPAQLEYEASPMVNIEGLPQRLQDVCKGVISTEQGKLYFEIDPKLLMNALSAELSII